MKGVSDANKNYEVEDRVDGNYGSPRLFSAYIIGP